MRIALVALLAALLPPIPASADPQAAPRPNVDAPAAMLLDRVAVRWNAPETGGIAKPQFIYERELAFESRLEALAEVEREAGPYKERHVRAAIDRHIAESLLANLPIVPAPGPKLIAARAEAARAILEQRVRGRDQLIAAAASEGISSDELDEILRREARASLYLDRMVAPMLEPTEIELREVFKSGASPFKNMTYEKAAPALGRWYVGLRLGQAIETFYQSARARVAITIVRKPGSNRPHR